MAEFREPKSMDECVYYTFRGIGETGEAKAWVFREKCKRCGKGLMGKPIDEKTGKPKIRAKEYVCPECGYTENKQEYEEKLTCNIIYTCPHCSYEGKVRIPFKRKKVQILYEQSGKKKSIDSLRFQCEGCKKNIDITKKMK